MLDVRDVLASGLVLATASFVGCVLALTVLRPRRANTFLDYGPRLLAILMLVLCTGGNYLAAPTFAIVNTLHLQRMARTRSQSHEQAPLGDQPLSPAPSGASIDQ